VIIELAPDYDLFVRILFVLWVFVGFSKFILGLAHIDRPNMDKYGFIEVLDGGFVMILAFVVIM
jgi:hypothetical protein